jgi:hypothetical protein
VSTPNEYHQYARESYESAAKAKTDAERNAFLQMAMTWEQAARQMEGGVSAYSMPQESGTIRAPDTLPFADG